MKKVILTKTGKVGFVEGANIEGTTLTFSDEESEEYYVDDKTWKDLHDESKKKETIKKIRIDKL